MRWVENIESNDKWGAKWFYLAHHKLWNCIPSVRSLTLHAYEQQVGCQLSPVPLGLLLVDPVPVETEEIENNLLPYCVVQGLLQIYPEMHEVIHMQNAWNTLFYTQRPETSQLIFKCAVIVPAGYKLVHKALVLQQAISHLNHKEQNDSGRCKSKKITNTVSSSKFTLVSDLCVCHQAKSGHSDRLLPWLSCVNA